MDMNIAIILCGGNGTRLWPLSTIHKPKQFINFFGEKTLLENTINRVPKKYDIILVSNIIYEPFMEKFNNKYTIIYETTKKNTGPSILTAILYIKNKYPDIESKNVNFIVLPSDHYFDNDKFNHMIEEGEKIIKKNKDNIITFGITPLYPEVGYGYIKYTGNKIINFIEKPQINKAQEFINSGNYLWNSGVFMFNFKNIVNLYKKENLNMYSLCQNIIDNSKKEDNIIYLKNYGENCPDISFDYAIMEHISSGTVIKYDGIWNDMGCWDRIYDFNEKDENNNVIVGNNLISNTKNSYIHSTNGIIITIGLDEIIVVKNGDEILISDMNNCNNIKLFNKYLETYHTNKKNYRPWGYYEVILKEMHTQVKKLIVYPKKRLSLQYHNHRSEHWVITKGNGQAHIGKDIKDVKKDDQVYIDIGQIHRIYNTGDVNMEIIETQIGDYLEEDDIVRIEDDYGRK